MQQIFDPVMRKAILASAHRQLATLDMQIAAITEVNEKLQTNVDLSDIRQTADRLRRLIAEIETRSGFNGMEN